MGDRPLTDAPTHASFIARGQPEGWWWTPSDLTQNQSTQDIILSADAARAFASDAQIKRILQLEDDVVEDVLEVRRVLPFIVRAGEQNPSCAERELHDDGRVGHGL